MNIRDGKSEHHEHLAFRGERTRAQRPIGSDTRQVRGFEFPSLSRFWSTSAFTAGSQPYARAPFQLASTHRKLDAVKRRYLSERDVERLMAGFCSRPV